MTDHYRDLRPGDVTARRRAVLADLAEQRAKLPRTDPSGRPMEYDRQSEAYRAAVTRAGHEQSHGVGPASVVDHGAALLEPRNPDGGYRFSQGSRDLRDRD